MLHVPRAVLLASASPRRRELLARLIPEFEVFSPDLDEDAFATQDPWQTAEHLAYVKAEVAHERFPDHLVIAGDTVVALPLEPGFRQLAKPRDVEDAVAILMALSGKTHLVITGVCLRWKQGVETFSDTTRVSFRRISEAEARAYVATGEPMDKAGAYAIQGGAGAFVERIEGSLTNVVGLPLESLESAIRKAFSQPAR